MFTMLLCHIFGTRWPSQLHHPDLFIWCHQIQIAASFPDPQIDHMSQLHDILKGIRVQAVRVERHPCPRLPITPSILRKLRRVWLEGSPTCTLLCYGQHPQPPSLTSVDLEKLQYSVNQSSTHKRTFVFQTSQWTMPFPQIPFPSSWNTQRQTDSGKEWN